MKIRIENDVFDIVNRIKEFDDGYFILYNQNNGKYELHNLYQNITYCLTIPYKELDSRVLDMIVYTNINNIDNIIYDIDKNNREIEIKNSKNLKSQTDYMLREIYSFANNSSKNMYDDSFTTIWR